nr:TetR/AcrR family transcriptional regulator [Burkholderia ambifaria]
MIGIAPCPARSRVSCGAVLRRLNHCHLHGQPTMKPTRLTREQRRLDTRERLIATARALFIAKGFADTSVEHIAEGAGYTRGAFYAHFEHKRELLIEILRRDHDRMITKIPAATPERGGSCTAADYANITAGWECFPLWVEVHLYALRDATFRHIVDGLHAEPAALPEMASGAAGAADRLPSATSWAAALGVALLSVSTQNARRDDST